ncbi:hypothetical protein [Anabaena sp. UHCC 0399]|uniref:hypothetical protein n=1 Tax=Anabaena sp. UHCC 0399 TaxID=3110238 RepID=UPI002B200F43|nr:hypothetical protein [Anabaena sp. UHCC 0399]MEA5566896.1 hypothetical protein [Anabaena sp. UHCC 0399]
MFIRYFCLALLLFGCSTASNFDSALSERLKHFDNQQKSIFNELYTYSSAAKEAQEYCNKRTSGKTEEDIAKEDVEWQINLVSEKKVTPDESADLLAIRVALQILALDFYCPQYKNKPLQPLKERIK